MANPPRIIALIPARAGSKRVPGKNLRALDRHPLLAYTIAAARECAIFDSIIVSTEDEHTASVARHYGAEVPLLRPVEYAGDHSPDIEWIHDILTRLRKAGREYECFSILRPTSPFRSPQTIQRAWQQFLAADPVDSLRAVERCRQHPGKMWIVNGKYMTPLLQSPPGVPWHSTPYQALPPVYEQNASLEIAWCRVVFDERSIAGTMIAPFISEGEEGFDINNQYDWEYAEKLVSSKQATLPRVCEPPFATERTAHG